MRYVELANQWPDIAWLIIIVGLIGALMGYLQRRKLIRRLDRLLGVLERPTERPPDPL